MSAPRVLIVDDTAAHREALRRPVEGEGYTVETAADGRDALARLKATPFDLVLLDVEMPQMDGPELLQALRNDPALAHLPVIMVSEVDDVDTAARCLELGADDYLPRQFPLPILRARMHAALDRKRLRDAERAQADSLTRELVVARKIQEDFLPQALPAVPGLGLDATLRPAREVSGDFYDAFVLAPWDTTVLVVGDVCDKGVGAALFMALFRSLIRAAADPVEGGAIQMIGGRRSVVVRSLEAASAVDTLTRVAGFTNDYIARLHGRTNMFATVFLGAITPHTGRLDYVNAGHEPALLVMPDGTTQGLRPTGPALGLRAGVTFAAGEATLEAGQSLVAFTDGLVEARSPSGEAFGADRLKEALRGNTASAKDLVGGVMRSLDAFTGQAERHDDVTLLAATLETAGWA